MRGRPLKTPGEDTVGAHKRKAPIRRVLTLILGAVYLALAGGSAMYLPTRILQGIAYNKTNIGVGVHNQDSACWPAGLSVIIHLFCEVGKLRRAIEAGSAAPCMPGAGYIPDRESQ